MACGSCGGLCHAGPLEEKGTLHGQALDSLLRTAPAEVSSQDLSAVTDVVQSESAPAASRIRAVEWILDVLLKTGDRGTQSTDRRPPPGAESTSEEMPPNLSTAGGAVGMDSQQATSSESSIQQDNAAAGSALPDGTTPSGLKEKAACALLSAAVGRHGKVRHAAASALLRMFEEDLSWALSKEHMDYISALAAERLWDIEPDVQAAWRKLLCKTLLTNSVSFGQ